ncbi:MAG: AbrB/MazE/SpoVT family DNA-binding domain-containing protein [Syntrophobacteraceae bacterium]
MALVKVIRNGQITLPKSLRDRLGIREGDLLEVTLTESGMHIAPKTAVDSDLVHSRFFSMVSELREKVKDVDPRELEAVLGEAVEAAKRATAEKDQGRR